MKIMIASDIHGSTTACRAILERVDAEHASTLFLLGDLYYHGVRNALPEGYAPMEVASLLNACNNLVVVKGNCDSEVDEMVSDFPFVENAFAYIGGRRVMLTHGHKLDKEKMLSNCDILVCGHMHTGFIEEVGAKITANCGSAALPKNGTEKSYMTLDENELVLKSLDGRVLAYRKL